LYFNVMLFGFIYQKNRIFYDFPFWLHAFARGKGQRCIFFLIVLRRLWERKLFQANACP